MGVKITEGPLHRVAELPAWGTMLQNQCYLIATNDVARLTHGIHKYPAKFIPHVPRWAILRYIGRNGNRPSSIRILDPFCGSGTALVEAVLLGHEAFGIDIDPLARLISKVKTTVIEKNVLIEGAERVLAEVESRSVPTTVPPIPNIRHWFREDIINDLSVIKEVVGQVQLPDLRDFLTICFSAIIRRVSNADDQSQKTYVSHKVAKQAIDVKPFFRFTVKQYIQRLLDFAEQVPHPPRVRLIDGGDARSVGRDWSCINSEPVDLAITSPPYIKALDYIYTQMLEYFWLGAQWGLSDQPSQNRYKENYIGTKQIYSNQYSTLQRSGDVEIDELIQRIYERDRKHAYIVYQYMADMQEHFHQMGQIMRTGSHYCVAIGDCSVSGYVVEVHNIFQQMAAKAGFCTENVFAYKIRNRYMRFDRKGRGGLIEVDWVLDFRKG